MTIDAEAAKQLLAELEDDPCSVLERVADELDKDHHAMGAGAILAFEAGTRSFTAGRHEVPGLARLMRGYESGTPEAAETLARAIGYVQTGRVSA